MKNFYEFTQDLKKELYGHSVTSELAEVIKAVFPSSETMHLTVGGTPITCSTGNARYSPPGMSGFDSSILERLTTVRVVVKEYEQDPYRQEVAFILQVDKDMHVKHIQENHWALLIGEDPIEGIDDPAELEEIDLKYDHENLLSAQELQVCMDSFESFLRRYVE